MSVQIVTVTAMGAAVASDQKIHIGMTSPSKDKKEEDEGEEDGFLAV